MNGGVAYSSQFWKTKVMSKTSGNYMGIKLLSHTMKQWKRVIESKIRQMSTIRENQFGFMLGESTTKALMP